MVVPGCEMPYKVPQENIKALRDSIESTDERDLPCNGP